jgi:ATP-dependent helicase HrpB
VADLFRKAEVMQRYFSRITAAEREVFAPREVAELVTLGPFGRRWSGATIHLLSSGLEQSVVAQNERLARRAETIRTSNRKARSGTYARCKARQRLETIAPTHLVVPSGSRIPIDYTEDAPTVAVRLQEVFGMHETPTVAEGRVPLTLQLLSPAHRPVQVTRDLVSFWARGYLDVKKELKGRYPKHYWPSLEELNNNQFTDPRKKK